MCRCSVGECVPRPSDLEEFILRPVRVWSVSLGVTGDRRLWTWQAAEVNRTKDGKTNKGKTSLKASFLSIEAAIFTYHPCMQERAYPVSCNYLVVAL